MGGKGRDNRVGGEVQQPHTLTVGRRMVGQPTLPPLQFQSELMRADGSSVMQRVEMLVHCTTT